jgi:hypothetical protein
VRDNRYQRLNWIDYKAVYAQVTNDGYYGAAAEKEFNRRLNSYYAINNNQPHVVQGTASDQRIIGRSHTHYNEQHGGSSSSTSRPSAGVTATGNAAQHAQFYLTPTKQKRSAPSPTSEYEKAWFNSESQNKMAGAFTEEQQAYLDQLFMQYGAGAGKGAGKGTPDARTANDSATDDINEEWYKRGRTRELFSRYKGGIGSELPRLTKALESKPKKWLLTVIAIEKTHDDDMTEPDKIDILRTAITDAESKAGK